MLKTEVQTQLNVISFLLISLPQNTPIFLHILNDCSKLHVNGWDSIVQHRQKVFHEVKLYFSVAFSILIF